MNKNSSNSNRAFTLIELMVVVAIIGILAAIAVPAFLKYIKKSKTTEARMNIRKIYDGEVAYFVDDRLSAAAGNILSKSFVTTVAAPATVPGINKVAGNWETGNWQLIHFSVDSPVFYQYVAVASGIGTTASFTARATGNLDGDLTTSLFERVGAINNRGEIAGGAGLFHNSDLE